MCIVSDQRWKAGENEGREVGRAGEGWGCKQSNENLLILRVRIYSSKSKAWLGVSHSNLLGKEGLREFLIHLFYKCLSSTLCVPGTALGARDMRASKIRQIRPRLPRHLMSQLLSCHLVVLTPSCLHSLTLPPCPQGPGLGDRKEKDGNLPHKTYPTPPQVTPLSLSLCPAVSQNDQRWDGGGEPGTTFLESRLNFL